MRSAKGTEVKLFLKQEWQDERISSFGTVGVVCEAYTDAKKDVNAGSATISEISPTTTHRTNL